MTTPLDRPALAFPHGGLAKDVPVISGGDRPCMAWFDDGTWHECKAHQWQRDGGGWLVHLTWGDGKKLVGDWFVYDPERVSGGQPSPEN